MTERELRDVLVGYSGFVGGNLAQQRHFDLLVNSTNTGDLAGGRFGDVVFSAAKAEKWRANRDPAADSAHVAELERLLGTFSCHRLILMSTVDVYGVPIGVDESTPIDTVGLHAYGLHRHRLEQTARRLHDTVLVLRLPGLFGHGLKKNVVFDLLRDNQVDRIQPASTLQYYNLAHLRVDIERAESLQLDLLNLAAEPVSSADIVREVFGREPLPEQPALPIVHYDMRTRHGEAGGNGYLYDRDSVLEQLRQFVSTIRAAE